MIKNRTIGDGQYGTHIAPLVAAVLATEGDIYEFGSGDFSTPVLHELMGYLKIHQPHRLLYSFDSNEQWVKNFADLDNGYWHFVSFISDWDKVIVRKCGVVFIDHAPAERRIVDIERFKDMADIIVVHDTQKSNYYGYEPLLSSFKYRFDYERYSQKTTFVSNFIDVTQIMET